MANLTITDQRLKPIADKVLAGTRREAQDGIALYRSPDLLAVGWLANHVREKRHGNVTYYNVNRHINPTNVCVAHCKLCAFGRDPNAPGAYTFALEEIYQRAEQGVREGATEFHIVGGLHPDLTFDHYLEMVRGLKQRCPTIHLKAFTMVEVHFFSRIAKISVEQVLQKMKEAGVDSCPGGGAEIFDHIKAYWIMLTPSIAQIALRFGANDLDGTVVEEKIYHDAGAKTSEFTPRAELERLIRAAGRVPVERDTLYRPVDRSKMPPIQVPPPRDLVSLTLNV